MTTLLYILIGFNVGFLARLVWDIVRLARLARRVTHQRARGED